MPIGDYCQRDVRTIDARDTLRAAAVRMAEEGVGCLVALLGSHPRAIVTDRDLALRVLRDGLDPDTTRVVDAFGTDPLVMHETSPLRAAAALMRRKSVRRIPIVNADEALVGILTSDDILRVVASELAGVAAAVAAQAPAERRPAPPGAAPEGE